MLFYGSVYGFFRASPPLPNTARQKSLFKAPFIVLGGGEASTFSPVEGRVKKVLPTYSAKPYFISLKNSEIMNAISSAWLALRRGSHWV